MDHHLRIIPALIVLLCLMGACKNPTTPEEGEADIIIFNDYGESLDIYINGDYLYPLDNHQQAEVDNVALGLYRMEAREPGTDVLIRSEYLEVTERVDYTWTIDDLADINIVNDCGTVLMVYLDGVFQFELEDEENRWILDLAFGDYYLKAVRQDSGSEVASVTITVSMDTDYTWTIE